MIFTDVSNAPRRETERAPGWWMSAPAWAGARVEGSRPRRAAVPLASGGELALVLRERRRWRLLTGVVEVAGAEGGVSGLARTVYEQVMRRLAAEDGAWSPVRFWNFIPAIHAPAGEGLDRYKAFNIGRHGALLAWSGSDEAFARRLPTATGVGHDGVELVVHCLAARSETVGVENPRQQPAYRYSRRFGPVAPSFARATAVEADDGGRELIIGGTSSVRGEESVHAGDAGAQLDETLANLRSLIAHSLGAPAGAGTSDPLSRLGSLRVYYVRPADLAGLRERLGEAVPGAGDVEFVRADICRAELLVEIEGVARLDGAHRDPGATG